MNNNEDEWNSKNLPKNLEREVIFISWNWDIHDMHLCFFKAT